MRDLEEILNRYINEEISFLTYRERRAQYIYNFVGSEYRADDTIPLSMVKQRDIQENIAEKIKNSINLDLSEESDQETSSNPTKQIAVIGLLVIVAVATWYFSTDTSNTKTPIAQPVSQPNINIEKEKVSVDLENEFILNFISRDQWDSNTLSEFLVKWQELSQSTRKQIKRSQSFIRLKNSLRLRIQEQKALQNIENKKAERQENLLIWFASQLTVTIR